MAITYHKAAADTGGAIGDEIASGGINTLFREITLAEQTSGITISRKFYIANSDIGPVTIYDLSMGDAAPFAAIIFESTGDAQVVGDLTGSETDESPIQITIPASSHVSFWIQLDIPIASTETVSFGTVNTQQTI